MDKSLTAYRLNLLEVSSNPMQYINKIKAIYEVLTFRERTAFAAISVALLTLHLIFIPGLPSDTSMDENGAVNESAPGESSPLNRGVILYRPYVNRGGSSSTMELV